MTPGSNEHLWELFDDVADLLLRGRAHLQVLVHGRREALRLFLDQKRILREAAEDTLYTLLRSYLSGTQICTIPARSGANLSNHTRRNEISIIFQFYHSKIPAPPARAERSQSRQRK